MNPKPFSSLNHFTVPVAICFPSRDVMCGETREVLMQPLRTLARVCRDAHPGAMNTQCTEVPRHQPMTGDAAVGSELLERLGHVAVAERLVPDDRDDGRERQHDQA